MRTGIQRDGSSNMRNAAGLLNIFNPVVVMLMALLPLTFGPSYAADAPAVSAKTAPEIKSDQIEEVIVTARRRAENIQTVPIAITVVSQQALQANNIQTVGNLQYLVPSMSVNTGLSRDELSVSIRGQATSGASLPGVVAYMNEVPIPVDIAGSLMGGPGLLFDLENVQVLKGPQGTLFGRNSVGGALLLQTARPKDEFGGHFQVTYGNYNDREIDTAINIPISDTVFMRFALYGQLRDGFTKILGEPGHPGGIDADNRDATAARGTLTIRPNTGFQNDTILTYSRFTSNGSPTVLTAVKPNGTAALVFPAIKRLFAQQQQLGIRTLIPIDTKIASAGSHLSLNNITRFDLGDGLTFRNIFGYAKVEQLHVFDLDDTALPLLDIPSRPTRWSFRQYTEEAQLLGKSFGGRLDWIVGAFVLDQAPYKDYALQVNTIFGSTSYADYRYGDKSKAVFAQGTYDLSAMIPGLKFTGGVRYTKDDRFNSSRKGPLGTCVQAPPNVVTACTQSTETKNSATTWTAGLDYQIAPDTLLYLTSRRGYRAGGANFPPAGSSAPGPKFGPEFVNDIELGVKSDFAVVNVPVRINADVYNQDYRDIQTSQVVLFNNVPTNFTLNAAAATISGVEFEALVQPTPNLQFGASFDYLGLKYTKIDRGVNATLLNTTRTANAIPHKYGLNARYRLPLDSNFGDVSVRVNWNWQAKSVKGTGVGGEIPAFGLLNLSADWNKIYGSPFDLSLFVSNATNKDYPVGGLFIYDSVGFAATRYGEPRMYGLRMNYRFGGEAR